jgi:hypothetical protein
MKAKTYQRLEQLEQISAKGASAQRAAVTGPQAIEKIRQLLHACGCEPEPHESLAEALARALGVTGLELKNRLRSGGLLA